MLKERLKEIREASGLSQKKVASEIGVSNQTIQKWEKGESEPRASDLIKMSGIYSVSIEEICIGKRTELNEQLSIKIREAEKLSDKEKYCLDTIIEAMIIRHRTREINIVLEN